MLLTDEERAPLKAIDFGLAAPFDPEHLPRTDLGLEGVSGKQGQLACGSLLHRYVYR